MKNKKLSTKISHFQHYDHWSELMENLICAKGLKDLVKMVLRSHLMRY